MKPLGDQRDHYWLALSMAKTSGVDLQAAIDSGHFSQDRWAEAVERCRGCGWGAECPQWLEEHAGEGRAAAECVNAELFRKLKRMQDAAAAREFAEET